MDKEKSALGVEFGPGEKANEETLKELSNGRGEGDEQ